MKKNIKKLFSIIILNFVLTASLFSVVLPVSASMLWGNNQDDIRDEVGLENRDPRLITASIIKAALGFLGVIAVIIVLYGGFKWMTSGGNEDSIREAKRILKSGVIGLIVVLAGWGVAQFTINILSNSTQ